MKSSSDEQKKGSKQLESPVNSPKSPKSPLKSPNRPKPLSPPRVVTSSATPTRTTPATQSPATTDSTTTTTSSPLPSPRTISRLATLAKPPIPAIPSLIRGRNPRHSIDVRTLPSYLDKKRHSAFGQFLSGN